MEDKYLAGLFDGEGCVQIFKTTYLKKGKKRPYTFNVIRMELSMTDEETVKRFHEATGYGTVRLIHKNQEPGSKPHYKDQWRWRSSHRQCFELAKRLIPYAYTKRKLLQKIIDHYTKGDHAKDGSKRED